LDKKSTLPEDMVVTRGLATNKDLLSKRMNSSGNKAMREKAGSDGHDQAA
jgi:hypothetical protein